MLCTIDPGTRVLSNSLMSGLCSCPSLSNVSCIWLTSTRSTCDGQEVTLLGHLVGEGVVLHIHCYLRVQEVTVLHDQMSSSREAKLRSYISYVTFGEVKLRSYKRTYHLRGGEVMILRTQVTVVTPSGWGSYGHSNLLSIIVRRP